MSIQNTNLAAVNAILGQHTYRKLARQLGGVQAFGRRTPISIVTVAEQLSLYEAMSLLSQVDYCSVNEGRALAADIAAVVLPVYERFKPFGASIKQAIETARSFAKGEISKAALGAAHKLAEAAKRDAVIAGEFYPAEYWAASAAVSATAPFGRPGEMVWSAWQNADMALTYLEGYLPAVQAVIPILKANKQIYGILEPHVEGGVDWLAMYQDKIRGAALDQLARLDTTRENGGKAFIEVLRRHTEVPA